MTVSRGKNVIVYYLPNQNIKRERNIGPPKMFIGQTIFEKSKEVQRLILQKFSKLSLGESIILMNMDDSQNFRKTQQIISIFVKSKIQLPRKTVFFLQIKDSLKICQDYRTNLSNTPLFTQSLRHQVLHLFYIIKVMNQTSSTKILSYRNAIYQGETKDSFRHGSGILITDDGVIIVSQWKQDLAFGAAFVFVNSEQYGLLEFNRGELQGLCQFRSGSEHLAIQFNNGRLIDRHLLINYDQSKLKILNYRNANYEVLQQIQLKGESEAGLIEEYLDVKAQSPNIIDYLLTHFCQEKESKFELKVLPNGTKMFRFNDKSMVISVGFVLGKNQQLVSYGSFISDKLHGFGCKYENNSKYQGQFENGFLNGEGMRFGNGKYSYGKFQNGNLVQALYLDERSTQSEEKLRQLRRISHIQSPFFFNAYVKKNLLKFKGITEITSMSSPVKQYLYSQNQQYQQPQQTLKNSHISLNQILSAKQPVRQQTDNQQLYNSSANKTKGRQEDFRNNQNSTGRRFNF